MSNVQCPTSRLVIGHSTLDICLSYGEGGIRTPDRGISPYNGLANRRLQPLGHLSKLLVSSKLTATSAGGYSQFGVSQKRPYVPQKRPSGRSIARHLVMRGDRSERGRRAPARPDRLSSPRCFWGRPYGPAELCSTCCRCRSLDRDSPPSWARQANAKTRSRALAPDGNGSHHSRAR